MMSGPFVPFLSVLLHLSDSLPPFSFKIKKQPSSSEQRASQKQNEMHPCISVSYHSARAPQVSGKPAGPGPLICWEVAWHDILNLLFSAWVFWTSHLTSSINVS